MSACAAAPVWPCAAAHRLCMHCLAALGWHTCPCSSTTPCLMEAQPRADPVAFCQALPAASSLLVTLCPALSADAPAAFCPAAPSCECAPSSCRLHCELHLTIGPTPACLQNPSANYQFSCRHPSMLNAKLSHPFPHTSQLSTAHRYIESLDAEAPALRYLSCSLQLKLLRPTAGRPSTRIWLMVPWYM